MYFLLETQHLWTDSLRVKSNMRFLILCLFFGIICATNKEKPVEKNYEQLIEIVEDLKSQVDDLKKNQNRDGRINNLKNELDYLKTNVSDQESRIQVSNLKSDEIGMKTFTSSI